VVARFSLQEADFRREGEREGGGLGARREEGGVEWKARRGSGEARRSGAEATPQACTFASL